MADSNRNRKGAKDADKKKGNRPGDENSRNRKLPDNPENADESVSARGDTSTGKYSKTNKRDEDVDNADTRGGR